MFYYYFENLMPFVCAKRKGQNFFKKTWVED